MKTLSKLILTISLSLAMISCAPRGEHKTVDEVLKIAKTRFTNIYTSAQEDNLKELVGVLETLLADKQGLKVKTNSDVVAKKLFTLNSSAGYTVRPAMRELILQFKSIADGKESKLYNHASLKLIIARTYSLVASELETTAFRL